MLHCFGFPLFVLWWSLGFPLVSLMVFLWLSFCSLLVLLRFSFSFSLLFFCPLVVLWFSFGFANGFANGFPLVVLLFSFGSSSVFLLLFFAVFCRFASFWVPWGALFWSPGGVWGSIFGVCGPQDHQEPPKRPEEGVFGAIFGSLVGWLWPTWGHLGPTWCRLGPTWGHLGPT